MDCSLDMAYSEVLALLNMLPKEEYIKIPSERIDFYRANCNKEYYATITADISALSKNVSKKTNAIIITIFRDYFANSNQKDKLNKILRNNYIEEENRKKEDSYKYDVFKTQNTVSKATSLVPSECKMSFFKKIIHRIRSFFKFNF